MTEICPHCGHRLSLGDSSKAEESELRAWCVAHGYWIGPGDTVTEGTAAAILGRAVKTLSGWRYGDQRLPFNRVGNRIRYRLADIAAFMDAER